MAAPVRIGDVLADKYKVTRILGVGGMGVVVAARHCELAKLVALKFMHEEISSNQQVTDRFLREARAAARLRNEHVAHVLDVGRLPGGVPYIVMEYLEGQDLGQLVEHHGPLDVGDATEYLLQACEAMAEAHAQGIIHRDLKPHNLFLTTRQDGRPLVKVLDFGISKTPFSQGPTSTSQAMGSPAYMAPEQIRSSRSVDARADIWSLGVILYQLLSNTLPFVGDTVPEVIFKVLSQPAPPLASIGRRVPPRLVSTIERCLEKDRERRFANVAELAHELVPFTPERARAAISLIEHVMTAGVRYPGASAVESEITASPTRTGETEVPRPSSGSPTQTTLAAAASSTSVRESSNQPRWRWLVMMATAMAATLIITIAAMHRSAPARPADSAVPVSAAPLAAANSIQFDAALGTTTDATPDAAIDAGPDATADAAPDAAIVVPHHSPHAPRARPHPSPYRIAVDAGTDPDSEPLFLEPARTDDRPLSPAR